MDGTINKDPVGYRIEVRAIDPVTGTPLTTASQNVPDKAGVLKTVASMATNVRVALGESKSEMTKVAAAETFTASLSRR